MLCPHCPTVHGPYWKKIAQQCFFQHGPCSAAREHRPYVPGLSYIGFGWIASDHRKWTYVIPLTTLCYTLCMFLFSFADRTFATGCFFSVKFVENSRSSTSINTRARGTPVAARARSEPTWAGDTWRQEMRCRRRSTSITVIRYYSRANCSTTEILPRKVPLHRDPDMR